MAGFLEGVFNLFGKKNERDRKAVQPRIDLINATYAEYAQLSDEALRNKTSEFRERLANHLSGIQSEIAELDNKVNQEDLDLDTKEEIFKAIDGLKKKQDEAIEVFLNEILPEAFAVMKETSRRFSEADVLRVKASDLDRELAIDAASWRSAEWACQRGLYAGVYEDAQALDDAVEGLAGRLAASNPEAMSALKRTFWGGTEHWDTLLAERAAVSGRLVLSAFTKEAIARFKAG